VAACHPRAAGRPVPRDVADKPVKNCTRCGELLPVDSFYFVSKKLGTRRGQCKECMREIKRSQRDPGWKPACSKCGRIRDRVGMGRRLCAECFDAIYDAEARRKNGSHRAKLNDCSACGVHRLRADHVSGASLCPVCRSVKQGRRTKLKTMYNMNPREYLALLDSQRGLCAICRGQRREGSLHIDHDHSDPRLIRGALCVSCNNLVGAGKDRPALLRAAATYLENPPAQLVLPGRIAHAKANRYNPQRRGGWNKGSL
jgi:hypothetical protein